MFRVLIFGGLGMFVIYIVLVVYENGDVVLIIILKEEGDFFLVYYFKLDFFVLFD